MTFKYLGYVIIKYHNLKMNTNSKKKKIHMRLASVRVNTLASGVQRIPRIFTPGEVITQQSEFMW